MRSEQLQYFVEVARQKSISKAAETLFIAQSSLSAQISLLERELDAALFIRTSKGVQLTEVGKLAVAKAEHILDELEDLATVGQSYASPFPLSETLEIGVTNEFFQKTLFDCNLHLTEKHPSSKISTTTLPVAECLQTVKTQKIHIGLVSYVDYLADSFHAYIQKNHIQAIPLCTEKTYLIINKHNKLYSEIHSAANIDYHDQVWLFAQKNFSSDFFNNEFSWLEEMPYPLLPQPQIAVDSFATALKYIQRNRGITIQQSSAIAENYQYFSDDIRLVPNNDNYINLCFIYKNDTTLTPLQQQFIKTYSHFYKKNHEKDEQIIETLL